MDTRLQDLCLQLHEIGALKFGDFKMKSGVNSPVYFDLRIMISYPKIMGSLSELLWEFVQSEKVDCDVICGVPYTALPLATLIAVKANLPMLIRRKEAKDYGTRKLIEGVFNKGDLCLIIEDVVTTGSSILETVSDLKKDGLVVKHSIVVLDREQGGKSNLSKQGIEMKPLLTLSQVLKYLKGAGRINDDTIEKILDYTRQTQLDTRGNSKSKEETSRLSMPLSLRVKQARSPLTASLLRLMDTKQSTLCVAADVTQTSKLMELATAVGPHIVVLKTHADIVTDWSQSSGEQLRALAKEHNFLILEDRKFADIGNTVGMQYRSTIEWADLVTVHGLPGEGVLSAIEEEVANQSKPRGVFIVAELSCSGNLINSQYTKSVMQQAAAYPQLVVGLVCQSADVVASPGLIQLTPGVSLTQTSDSHGQQYNSPHTVVVDGGADLAVVGRSIINAADPGAAAKKYKTELWNAYLERVQA